MILYLLLFFLLPLLLNINIMASIYNIFTIRRKSTRKYRPFLDILCRRHAAWREVVSKVGRLDFEVPVWRSLEDTVLYAVVGQMLSIAAAGTIIRRLLDRFGNAAGVLKWAQRSCHRKGAACGLSQNKRKALAAWAEFSEGRKNLSGRWRRCELEDYRREITQLRGFGRWSADMIAIFHLGRMDVWPETDKGVDVAVRRIFKKRSARGMKKIVEGCETVAAIYLWEYLSKN